DPLAGPRPSASHDQRPIFRNLPDPRLELKRQVGSGEVNHTAALALPGKFELLLNRCGGYHAHSCCPQHLLSTRLPPIWPRPGETFTLPNERDNDTTRKIRQAPRLDRGLLRRPQFHACAKVARRLDKQRSEQ